MKNKKVVITGASGFVGLALCRKLLSEGSQVVALVRDAQGLKELAHHKNLSIIEVSLASYRSLDSVEIRNADCFYHIAWDGTWGKAFADYDKQLKNAIYACDAYQLASDSNVKRFVLVTTINSFEIHHYLHNKESKPRTACIYGTAKIAAGLIGKTLAQQSDCEFVTAVLPSVFGPGDNSGMVQNILIRNFMDNVSPKLVEGNFTYDWVYIDDVVDMLSLLMSPTLDDSSYYLGNRKPGTFKEVVTQVRDILNPEVPLEFGSFPDVNAIDYNLIDTETVYQEFGYEVVSDFEESILKTANWLRKEKSL